VWSISSLDQRQFKHNCPESYHALGCADLKFTSAAPWDNNVSVTSHFNINTEREHSNCVVNSDIDEPYMYSAVEMSIDIFGSRYSYLF